MLFSMSSVTRSQTLKPLTLKPGPFQIIEQESLDSPSEAPKRRYECSHYETCLNLAAAMNWDSFTCRGCNGEVNESYFWRAQQEAKRDKIVRTLCSHMPDISLVSNGQNTTSQTYDSEQNICDSINSTNIENDLNPSYFEELFRVAGKK
jgi:hypothetical protein